MFTHERWNQLLKETIEQIHLLSTVKGGEYAGDGDRLANFRRNGLAAGVPMSTVWRIYAGKHWDSISQWCHDQQTGKERPRSENMLGRFDDLIVYAILGKAIYLEMTKDEDNFKVPGATTT